MAGSLVDVGRDLGRLFQERPAIVVGAGVLGLIGVSLLGRGGGGDAAPADELVLPTSPPIGPLDPGPWIVDPPVFTLPPIIEPLPYVDPGYIFDPPTIYEPSPAPFTPPIVPAPTYPAPPLPRPPTPTPAAPKKYSIRITAGATVRAYTLSGAKIASWTDTKWGSSSSTAPASAPVSRVTVDGRSSATTTLVTAGRFAGKHVRIGSGVSLI